MEIPKNNRYVDNGLMCWSHGATCWGERCVAFRFIQNQERKAFDLGPPNHPDRTLKLEAAQAEGWVFPTLQVRGDLREHIGQRYTDSDKGWCSALPTDHE